MELAAGSLIGPYRITAPAGHGGMGVVWKAHDTVLDRPVAIKILHADDERSSEHIVREARLAARLTHPNVVTVHEVRREGPSACIVMEWIAGESLAERIVPGGLVLQAALAYAIPIARALEAAHAAGIIHRDLKPSNVMLPVSGEAKLVDFGIAKSLPSTADLTSDTVTAPTVGVRGTAAYMSPEQVRGQPLDARSDVFSFGTLLYELFTGRRAFGGPDPFSTMSAVLNHEPAVPTHAGGELLPDAAVNIVMRCLRKDVSRRFQTAADLRAALEDLAETPRHPLPVISGRRAARRWMWAAAAPVVIATAGTWFYLSRGSPPRLGPVRQITFDAGIATTPALSPDGKLMAYASDRAVSGNLDIWLRQVAGGSSARLTTDPGADWNPQFSPDGTRLLYLSGDQDIVEIPVLGGSSQAPRPVASAAGPFSVASTGAIAFLRLPQPARSGPMFVIPAAGAPAEPWQPDCRSAWRPVWSPEGDRLLFWGQCGNSGLSAFWWAPLNGGERHPVPTPADLQPSWFARTLGWFRHHGKDGVLFDSASTAAPGPSWLLLTGAVSSLAQTSGPLAFAALGAAGEVMLADGDHAHAIWHLAPGSAEPRQIASAIGHYAASRDGRTVVFGRLIGGGSGELVFRDLSSGTERVFASHDSITSSVGSIWPQMAPDGRQIVYRVVGQNGGHYVLDTATGAARRLASLQEFQLGSDWSADSRRVLGECSEPAFGICEMDATTGRITVLLRHPTDQLIYPSWSADGEWLVFGRRKPGQPSSVWAARAEGGRNVAPESAWVRISAPGADCHRPRFSLDGSAVYYVAGTAGLRHLLRHPLHARTKAPAGEATSLLPFPLEILVVTTGFGPYPLITVTERGLFFSTIGRRGNLFLSQIE